MCYDWKLCLFYSILVVYSNVVHRRKRYGREPDNNIGSCDDRCHWNVCRRYPTEQEKYSRAKNDHEKISIRMEDSQRALVSGITDIKRTQIAQDSKISSVSNEVSRQAEMRSTVMRNGVNIDKVLSEVSALGGIVDTYEKELEEYKKQVFELMK